ncbi:MAG: heavy-metal-associated domain-containing protein [Rikenellaceae bacterium]
MKNITKALYRIVLAIAITAMSAVTSTATAQRSNNNEITIELATDLHCASCKKKIMDTLPYKRGIKSVEADVESKVVTVTFDSEKSSEAEIIEHLAKIKVAAEPLTKQNN